MNKIKQFLDHPACGMIRPGYRYNHDKPGRPEQQPWQANHLETLHNLISQCMQTQKELYSSLEEHVPILYIDCQYKGEKNILSFILEHYSLQSSAMNKKDIITQHMSEHTLVFDKKQALADYIEANEPSLEQLFAHYQQSLDALLVTYPSPEHRKIIMDGESTLFFDDIAALMKHENTQHMSLYLDNIHHLSLEETQHINQLLYTGGRVKNQWIRLKINDGNDARKTRQTMGGIGVRATHDYHEVSIYEHEIE